MFVPNTAFETDNEKFLECTTNLERINFFLNKENILKIRQLNNNNRTKNDERSKEIREAGNTLFKQNKFFEALEKYTLSLAWAKTKPTKSLAHANRSAVLAKLGLNKQCSRDIEIALENDYPEELRQKLISRKVDVDGKQTVSKTRILPVNQNSAVQIRNNEKYGRHLTAARDIEIGELLVVEQPFASFLLSDYLIHCHECLTVCYNLIPCDNCPKALYCSDTCKKTAFENYHQYECQILNFLQEFGSMKDVLALTLKVTLLMKNSPVKYNEIGKLLTHTEKRSIKNVYDMSYMTCAVFTFLKEKTDLFDELKDFKELFFTNLQIIDINSVSINRLELNPVGYKRVKYASGLYSLYSLFNHSCYPNTFFYHDGSTLVVRALATIKKGDQCFISYCHTYGTSPKLKRQTELKNKYYFTCTCKACEENWPEEKEENNKNFDEPFALLQMALLENDSDLIATVGSMFVEKIKKIEKFAPFSGIACFRQLIVDCFQVYQNPKKF